MYFVCSLKRSIVTTHVFGGKVERKAHRMRQKRQKKLNDQVNLSSVAVCLATTRFHSCASNEFSSHFFFVSSSSSCTKSKNNQPYASLHSHKFESQNSTRNANGNTNTHNHACIYSCSRDKPMPLSYFHFLSRINRNRNENDDRNVEIVKKPNQKIVHEVEELFREFRANAFAPDEMMYSL